MLLSELFSRCLNAKYKNAGAAANYKTEREGDSLYIFFEWSNGTVDWLRNFDFPITVCHGCGRNILAHRGFVKAWSEALPWVEADILDPEVKSIISVGYSHGAALALLCHGFAWQERPDIREYIHGWGFGAPRVLFGKRARKSPRYEGFSVIRNINDIVTHLPPRILGYSHPGHLIEIGKRGKYSATDAHRSENILSELELYERSHSFPALKERLFSERLSEQDSSS